MKKRTFIGIVCGLLAIHSLYAQNNTSNQNKTTATNSVPIRMQGAYLMQRQTYTDGTMDTTITSPQIKLFTDRYMLYVNRHTYDSLASYGIARYEIRNGKVYEYVFHRDSVGAMKDTFELNIEPRNDGYRQILRFQNQGSMATLVEDYRKVDRNARSPLDGAWKLTKVESISPNGEQTVDNNPTQFKVYQSGYFAWVHTYTDSATRKPLTAYGYGTYDMEGNNRSIEMNTSSTYNATLVNIPIRVALEFIGTDSYRQTIEFPSGAKGIETYVRMK